MNQDFKDYADFVAEVAKDYMLAKADGKFDLQDTVLLIPIFAKIPAMIAGSSNAFNGLSADDVKAAAMEVLQAAGQTDGKLALYVEKAYSIVSHGIGIFGDVKEIMAA